MLYYLSTIAWRSLVNILPTAQYPFPSLFICLNMTPHIKLLLLKYGRFSLGFYKPLYIECKFCPNQWALIETSHTHSLWICFYSKLKNLTLQDKLFDKTVFFKTRRILADFFHFFKSVRSSSATVPKHLCLHFCYKESRWKHWILGHTWTACRRGE